MVEPVVAPDVDQGLVLVDIVQDHDVDADLVVDYVVTDVVDKADDDVILYVLLLPDVVVELLLLNVFYDDDVDAVVYSSSVDLLVVHLDVVVHDDQLIDDELLMLILDVNLFDVYLLLFLLDAADLVVLSNDVFDVLCFESILFADHADVLDACCISMFDGLLSSFAVCISDVDAAAMF